MYKKVHLLNDSIRWVVKLKKSRHLEMVSGSNNELIRCYFISVWKLDRIRKSADIRQR